MRIQVPQFDQEDIVLVYPNGSTVRLQMRDIEAPTLDILFEDDVVVHNWTGQAMNPAPVLRSGESHVRSHVNQVMVELPPEYV